MDEKDFDFDNLTREQTVYLHRKLWNTLADKILEWKRPVEKREIFKLYGWPTVYGYCWCCAYDEKFKPACKHCPIQWAKGEINNCRCYDTPYRKWEWNMCIIRGHIQYVRYWELNELADYARQIANLPERKD